MTERAAYRVNEFAKAIGVHRITVWRWIRAGDIPTIRLGQTTLIPAYVLTHGSARRVAQLSATSSIAKDYARNWHFKRNATDGNGL